MKIASEGGDLKTRYPSELLLTIVVLEGVFDCTLENLRVDSCPHGRPTTIVLSRARLAGMFLRT